LLKNIFTFDQFLVLYNGWKGDNTGVNPCFYYCRCFRTKPVSSGDVAGASVGYELRYIIIRRAIGETAVETIGEFEIF
jgi:hypothetical protein